MTPYTSRLHLMDRLRTHTEGKLSRFRCRMHVQKQIKRAQHAKQETIQFRQADAPAALFVLVRPERASVRFELAQRAAFVAIVNGFEDLGWPAPLGDLDLARSACNLIDGLHSNS